jgi:NAD(P)H-dependent FMN reductase
MRSEAMPESDFMSSDTPPVIGFICGSLREESINKQLEKALVKRFKRAGMKTTSINLGTYDLPIFHGDLDMPDGVKKLSRKIKSCDGVVVISPEYNGGLPPVLKNAIDWTSTTGKAHFEAPYWGIASCAPGPMSGIMCMRQVNYILMRLGAHVSPIQVGVGKAHIAFDSKGELIAEPSATLADNLIKDMLAHI